MDRLQQRLTTVFENHPQLKSLRQRLVDERLDSWLVGGCLRDLLLDRAVVDIDIATAGDPSELARRWAAACNGRWFWLDAGRQQSRVLLPNQLVVDFVPLRAANIDADLRLRDYSINAMALPLRGELSGNGLLDPLGGQQHLKEKRLQLCSETSLTDDPLRMLKGIRHAVCLELQLTEQTLQQIRCSATLLKQVAGERLRDELGKILLAENPVAGFELLQETQLLPAIFGSPGPRWQPLQAFADLRDFDRRMQQQETGDEDVALAEPFSSRSQFLLATLIRHYQVSDLADLLHRRLRLSRQQQRIISSLQTELPDHWFSQLAQVVSPRQKALLVESLGYFPAEQLIYWSLYRQQLPLSTVYELLNAFQAQQRLGRVPDLLDGHQMQQLLRDSGRQIGEWQQQIKQAELSGEIADCEGAKDWLKNKISD